MHNNSDNIFIMKKQLSIVPTDLARSSDVLNLGTSTEALVRNSLQNQWVLMGSGVWITLL